MDRTFEVRTFRGCATATAWPTDAEIGDCWYAQDANALMIRTVKGWHMKPALT